jgi:hypothetical protein
MSIDGLRHARSNPRAIDALEVIEPD